MRLRILEREEWTVCAIEESSGSNEHCCPVVEFLGDLPKQYHGSRNGVFKYFGECAQRGTQWLNDEQSHLIDNKHKIFEFIKGALRITWFYGEGGKLIICCHGFIKDSNKTKKKDKDRAIKAKQAYLAAVESKNVVLVEEPEE